jgi:hypothetical protein
MVTRFISNIPFQVQRTTRFIEPLVEERFEQMDKFGEAWENPPVRDLVTTWIFVLIKTE